MIRKANIEDPPAIAAMINHYASKELMLARPLHEVYEHLRDFWVCEKSGGVAGCAALHISWQDLGEIRSLAVAEQHQGKGIGTHLVEACVREARELGLEKLFVLTYETEFFAGFGFRKCAKKELPHKIWSDCVRCPKFPNCDEEAMILSL